MEQVLSSPRGHSDWESDQSSLGFLLLDSDDVAADGEREEPQRRQRGEPGIVSLSFDEIFQDSSLNLDELFRASRYSGLDQAYPWECSSDCVSPSWDRQRSLPQRDAEGDSQETPRDVVTADLITFNSAAPSPTHTCASMQAGQVLQPVGTVSADCPLDGLIGRLPLDPVLDLTRSETLPARRTSVVEESSDLHRTTDSTFSQTAPEKAMDLLCASLVDLTEGSSSRTESCNFGTSLEALIPLPFIYDLSSSPSCSVSHPDAPDEVSPSLYLESPVQPRDGSHAILRTAETTITGLSSEQERDIPSISNMTRDGAAEVRPRPQSPVSPLASSKLSEQERTLAGSDSEAKPGTPPKSIVTDGPPDSSPSGLSHERPCEDETTGEMKDVMERDIPPNDPTAQELDQGFALAVPLLSPSSIPEQTAPVESTSTFPDPETDFLPEYSNDEHCVKSHSSEIDTALETSGDSIKNSTRSVICDSRSDDIRNPKSLAPEKEIIVDTFPATQNESPPVPPSVCLTLEACAETDPISLDFESQTRATAEKESKHNPSESADSPENTGKEQTINTPSVDTRDKVMHTSAAVDAHLLLHIQEVAPVHKSASGTTRHCPDLSGRTDEINQQPNGQDEWERLRLGAHNYTPEERATSKDIHVTSDDLQDPHAVTESTDGSVNAQTPDSTPVSKENTPSCAMLPAPGSPVEEEIVGLDHVTHAFVSLPGHLDSTLLSGAGSPLSQVGMAMEQERGEATSRLGQSVDVRADGKPDQLTRPDPSQVAGPTLGDETPDGGGTCPPLMEDDVAAPDGPDNADMALELCESSDAIQDGSVGAGALPAASPQDDEHSALRAVFQALDQDGDGFVRVEEFMDFATAYGVEQVMSLTLFINVYTRASR